MVSIPKVLTNKTVFTGLAASPLKAGSLFRPANAASAVKPVGSKADIMGKVSLAATPSLKAGKISAFAADSTVSTTYIPTGLGRPNFIQGHSISFR